MDLKPGDHVGSYRLVECIGQGGMGQVWKANDLRLERTVALKVVADAGDEVRQALIAEAKTASRLSHPNIAVIYDAGEADGNPYIAMEYVEGATLRSMMNRAWTDVNLTRVALQAGEGLAHAHQRGIVHRDIKPSNLMVTPQGRLEILDFGIAKRESAGGSAGDAATLVHVTTPGISVGTPAYMSPEQVIGQPATPASDQFSLAVVLYELATGVHPFKRDSVVETMHAVLKEIPPSLRECRPDLAPALADAVDRAMAKSLQARFPNMEAFIASFDETSQGTKPIHLSGFTGIINPPEKPRAKTAVKLALAAAGILALGIAGGWFLLRGRKTPSGDASRTIAVLPLEQVVPNSGESWMGTSLGDAMTMALSRRKGLMVLDRVWVGEVMHRLGEKPGQVPVQMQRLSKELKADIWVMGTYQVMDGQLRLNVRALDAGQGAVLSQMVLNGATKDLLALEDEIQVKLPAMLGAKGGLDNLDPHSKARSPQTRELFAKASDLASQGNADSFDAAAKLYRQALELEPDYAPARAGLAWSLQGLGSAESHLGKPDQARAHFKEAQVEAAKAVSLDPKLSFGHRALAAAYNRLGKYPEAKGAAAHAVALDPTDSQAYTFLADAYAYEEGPAAYAMARTDYEKALDLDPASWFAHYRYAVLLQNAGELELSVAEARRAVELQPSSDSAHLAAANALIWMGRYDEAGKEVRDGLAQVPSARLLKLTLAELAYSRQDKVTCAAVGEDLKDSWPKENYAAILLRGLGRWAQGDGPEMKRLFLATAEDSQSPDWVARSANERRGASVNLYMMARSMALAGDRDSAQRLLEAAERMTSGKRKIASVDPAFKA